MRQLGARIDAKDLMLLSSIPTDQQDGIGLLELLSMTKRRTLGKARIGSQHTLEDRLRRLRSLGLIRRREGRQIGRGHKAGYYLTEAGMAIIRDKQARRHLVNFESPELQYLRELPNTSTDDREITVFSDPPLSLVISDAEKLTLFEDLTDPYISLMDTMLKIEDVFRSAHEQNEKFLRSHVWTNQKLQILEVLRRRWTFQQRKGIKAIGNRYPREVIQMAKRVNELRAQMASKWPEPFRPDNLPYSLVKKQLDNVPLSRKEHQHYRELLRFERRHDEAWASMKEPSIALLICNKRFIDELQIRASLVKKEDGHSYEIADGFFKGLKNTDLLKCEKEFWEAANTDKYVKDIVINECNKRGETISGGYSPAPGASVGLHYPLRTSPLSLFGYGSPKDAKEIDISLTLRLRREYFRRMHGIISKEVNSRNLAQLAHDPNGTYKDFIESRRKELQVQYGPLSDPDVKDEGLRVIVSFKIRGLKPLKFPSPGTKRGRSFIQSLMQSTDNIRVPAEGLRKTSKRN